MNAFETGQRLVALYNSGDFETIYRDLYADNVQSIESDGMTADGMAGINAKNEWWEANFETHSSVAKGPFPHGDNQFAVIFESDITHKESGSRSKFDEVGVYSTEGGKVVAERFFYPPQS